MTEVINAIKSLYSRDLFDYVSAFSPLLLSCIAIIIALLTSKKQNTISIFEKRYSNYSELLGLCTVWRMFINQFYRLYQLNDQNFVDTICKLCLPLSLIGLDETKDYDISDYVKDQELNRDAVRRALLDLAYKNSLSLEMASLINGKFAREIDFFHKKYAIFQDELEKMTLGEITKDALLKDVKDFEKYLGDFYSLVFKKIKLKVRIID